MCVDTTEKQCTSVTKITVGGHQVLLNLVGNIFASRKIYFVSATLRKLHEFTDDSKQRLIICPGFTFREVHFAKNQSLWDDLKDPRKNKFSLLEKDEKRYIAIGIITHCVDVLREGKIFFHIRASDTWAACIITIVFIFVYLCF